MCGRKKRLIFAIVNNKTSKEMTTNVKAPNWKRIIEFVIVILTTIASFIGGNVSANNGYKLVNQINYEKIK